MTSRSDNPRPIRSLVLAATAAVAAGLLAAPALQAQDDAPSRGQAKLARMLEGKVAGAPEDCIRTSPTRSFTVIDETALVYRQGGTLWVNTTRNPRDIDDNSFMVIDRFSASQLCRTDQISLRERSGGFFAGILFLGDFVPYRDPA